MHGMKSNLALAVFGLGLAGTPMLAHHSVEKQYDLNQMVTIQGVVTQIEWVNPHSRLLVDADNADGTVSSWEMELHAPNALRKESVRMDFVKQGDQVTITLWRAKNGSRLGHALTLTAPGGRVMNFPRSWGMPASPR
jgi:hypothetical protein